MGTNGNGNFTVEAYFVVFSLNPAYLRKITFISANGDFR
jgi:hypothetical protein